MAQSYILGRAGEIPRMEGYSLVHVRPSQLTCHSSFKRMNNNLRLFDLQCCTGIVAVSCILVVSHKLLDRCPRHLRSMDWMYGHLGSQLSVHTADSYCHPLRSCRSIYIADATKTRDTPNWKNSTIAALYSRRDERRVVCEMCSHCDIVLNISAPVKAGERGYFESAICVSDLKRISNSRSSKPPINNAGF